MKIAVFKILLMSGYIAMIVMNFLANSLPLNNRSTGAISDAYPSYFTPAGFAFSIWALIYILVGAFVIRGLLMPEDEFFSTFLTTVLILFLVSCVMNVLWLVCWHYDYILMSTIVMVLLLVSLIWLAFFIPLEDSLFKVTFSIYAGWISIALIANITILLVKSDLPLFMNHEIFWYITIMIVGVVIGLLTLILTKNIPYLLVYVWAYFAIFMKHLSSEGRFLPSHYHLFNGILLTVLVLAAATMFFVNEFKFFR